MVTTALDDQDSSRPATSATAEESATGWVDKVRVERKPSTEVTRQPWPIRSRRHTQTFKATWTLWHRIANIYNSWTYSYMNPILDKGRKQFKSGEHLSDDDLYSVPDDLRSDFLVAKFWKHYQETLSLLPALWRIATPDFVPAGVWELIFVLTRLSLPLFFRQLLIAFEKYPAQVIVSQGFPYVVGMSLASVIGAFAQNQMVFLSTKSGIALRGALTAAIYQRAQQLSPAGRVGLTSGEITNLVAVDTQKLYDVMLELHNLWSCPFLIIATSTILGLIIGAELIVGVATMMFMVPFVQAIVVRMLFVRKERSQLTDVRINILTSMLQGIRVSKLNHYESKIESHVMKVRRQEMRLLRRELSLWGWIMSTAVSAPLIATAVAFAFYALVDEENIVLPSDAFSALLLFSVLRFPINLLSRLAGKIAQSVEAVRRISNFLEREVRPDLDPAIANASDPDARILDLKFGEFYVKHQDPLPNKEESSKDNASMTNPANAERSVAPDSLENSSHQAEFAIRNINMEVAKSELFAVVGKVGSGKTVLLQALLGEIPACPTTEMSITGSIAYAPQLPFILNKSLRENVLFGSEYNRQRYEEVLDVCCLCADIARLGPAGDLTQIGERGVTLSGGQRQRVALARAVYANADLALLDDCFSALDSDTARAVFVGLFGGGGENAGRAGALRRGGTILVTHAVYFLPCVDKILVMSDGSPSFLGTWNELQDDRKEGLGHLESEHANAQQNTKHSTKRRREGIGEEDGFIMTVEEREYGRSRLDIWLKWFANAGGWGFFLSQLVLLFLDRLFFVASDWWLAKWSESAYQGLEILGYNFPPQTAGRSAQVQYVTVYLIIVALSVTACALRAQWAFAAAARCAKNMFSSMTHSVLRAPMSYFETTPLGRILNRFTYDVEVLDVELSVSMSALMVLFSWLIGCVVVMAAVLPWMLLGIVPVTIAYFFIQLYYRMSGPDIQRIDAMSRSPLQAALAEGLEGCASIRAFRKEKKFAREFRNYVDNNTSAMLNFLGAQRWLGLRIELLGSSIAFALSTVVVFGNEKLQISAGFIGLVIQWAVIFSAALNLFFQRLSECEARITSIERVHKTTMLPQEASWETKSSVKLVAAWPSQGKLVFDRVCMRYREELPWALDQVSFRLHPGMRCGVVGRTGSGKTSITAVLFRLVEAESGSIRLDGVDLSTLGLTDVRGRPNGLRILPQEPVLYAGTLRDCLDPFHCESDEKILEALKAVNHRGAVDRDLAVLDDPVEEGGVNFSVGERQLLCLARAIVEEPRVLVLDEATASVDSSTDTFIQEMLRTRFQNTTLLTVAHRLHTIIDYDVVLVMEGGRCVEFGPPRDLLEDASGIFTSFVEATGPDSAAKLRRIANAKK